MQKKIDLLVRIVVGIVELIGVVLKEKGKMSGLFDGHPWMAGDTVMVKVEEPGHPL